MKAPRVSTYFIALLVLGIIAVTAYAISLKREIASYQVEYNELYESCLNGGNNG